MLLASDSEDFLRMMQVYLTCSGNGVLRSCCGKGHAGYAPSGSDIVCAATTILLRTALQVLTEAYGALIVVNAPEPGTLEFLVKEGIDDKSRLIYAADFLRAGFKSLQNEFPKHIAFTEIIAE